MPSLYTITEPHPTVPQNSYTHSGRGGLGNFFRAPATTSPSGVPMAVAAAAAPRTSSSTTSPTTTSSSSSSSSSTRRFYSGRGGAGNAHTASERPVLSFDEEFTRAEVREKTATLSHVGRGGAGNTTSGSFFGGGSSKKSNDDDGSSSLTRRDSASTEGSGRSSIGGGGFWERVRSVGH
ncbi:hypothetical protein C8A00DRAFT_34489 [Chaetomidium leptoderma]|uniref:Uncharacterized protein n=1 Tax=Chaetomidium leptoderma TaxID=669021 RepID=A0AAN6ZWK9_9PEZI|nr:hypothetical protein C8A00DRAFT_34489 [Chaetomidium leptoderma]